ncbi:MAG: hypothetical protein VKK59_03470, partial [Vampirovibrionales bacterium]|nr:hypothetical protein [Vampirovibrionales bacterium]
TSTNKRQEEGIMQPVYPKQAAAAETRFKRASLDVTDTPGNFIRAEHGQTYDIQLIMEVSRHLNR